MNFVAIFIASKTTMTPSAAHSAGSETNEPALMK